MYANMWQVIVSFIYLGYNALLTCMLVGEEWAGFAHERKTLRVTHPRGIQRSSYFVSMPYKYGIPLMVANTVLHILISQSLFIVSIIAYRPDLVELQDMSYTLVGYSFSAIVVCKSTPYTFVTRLTGDISGLCRLFHCLHIDRHIVLQDLRRRSTRINEQHRNQRCMPSPRR